MRGARHDDTNHDKRKNGLPARKGLRRCTTPLR